MATSMNNPLLSTWSAALASAGITGVGVVLDATEDGHEDASGEARFRWGGLILRLVRDRGQDFVDLAPAAEPSSYFRLDDLGVAQGWRSIESIIARQEPIPLADELREIAQRRSVLENALAAQQLSATRTAVADAQKRRERAFLDKLKKLAGGH